MTSIGRIIDALFRDPDRTVAGARVDLAYTENETMIEVGPHPGFADGSMVVVMRQGSRENLHQYELEFSLTDVREARAPAPPPARSRGRPPGRACRVPCARARPGSS